MRGNIRKMKKADLLECLEVTLDYLGMEDIEGPGELQEELDYLYESNIRMFNKALEGEYTKEQLEEVKERLHPGPTARKAIKEKKYAFIQDQANKELEKNPKLSMIEAKRRANKMMPNEIGCDAYKEEELKKIKL